MAKASLILVFVAAAAAAGSGRFSVDGLDGWEPQTFKGKAPTTYALVRDGDTHVLGARCKASASGLVRKQAVDLARTPRLNWRWRLDEVADNPREREKAGDDFPLRVYVVRDGGWLWWRTRSLVYVWASREPAGADWPNPYTAQAHTVVLRSGTVDAGRWQAESRDVRADFRRYFGLDLDHADGVAVMTDCDDTGGVVRGAYGDLTFR